MSDPALPVEACLDALRQHLRERDEALLQAPGAARASALLLNRQAK